MTERESQIVLGLDPDPSALWPGSEAASEASARPADRAGAAMLGHCRALIDATSEACVAVKLQLARFEVLGAGGWGVLAAVAAHARQRGLLVIADGKRGDIDVTAGAYAAALIGGLQTPFGRLEGLGADLVTVNPLMGTDAIEPFVTAARAAGAGVLLLVRTSNPGAADVEDLTVEGGGAVWERIAEIVNRLGEAGVGETGISDVGAVIGATDAAPPRPRSRADGCGDVPAPGRRRAGRPRGGSGSGVRTRARGRAGLGVAQHRERV